MVSYWAADLFMMLAVSGLHISCTNQKSRIWTWKCLIPVYIGFFKLSPSNHISLLYNFEIWKKKKKSLKKSKIFRVTQKMKSFYKTLTSQPISSQIRGEAGVSHHALQFTPSPHVHRYFLKTQTEAEATSGDMTSTVRPRWPIRGLQLSCSVSSLWQEFYKSDLKHICVFGGSNTRGLNRLSELAPTWTEIWIISESKTTQTASPACESRMWHHHRTSPEVCWSTWPLRPLWPLWPLRPLRPPEAS